MNPYQDDLVTQLTVRLRTADTNSVIGTGILYYASNLKDKVYIITASHCLHSDGEGLTTPLQSIKIDLYNSSDDKYYEILVEHLNLSLLSKDIDKDIGLIILEKKEVENRIGSIPIVRAISQRLSYTNFVIKGFPKATDGQELVKILPTWLQEMPIVPKFQLQLHEDYIYEEVQGFSGSGALLYDREEIYLLGIFTRFREEERGKVIYCQNIQLANELLHKNFLPIIKYDYIGDNNINHLFIQRHVEKAIKNLGQRYSEELNLKLPIAKLFNDLVRDNDFDYRLLQTFDIWLSKMNDNVPSKDSELYNVINNLHELKKDIYSWFNQKPFKIPNQIDVTWIEERIQTANEIIKDKLDSLYIKQGELAKQKKGNGVYRGELPLDQEINKLRKYLSNNHYFESALRENVSFSLTNFPVLILKGEAGSGKSHLLGDIALSRLKQELPSLLLLGQHFKVSKSIERNILELLDLDCSFEALLDSLNEIGKQLGTRIPILIDALNEGAGVDLWREGILGLINSVVKYDYLGLVFSIRTTYFDLLGLDSLDDPITIKSHEGFAGNEYAALKLFCEYHGLKQPNFPILSPEFTRPLFLLLICKGVQNSPTKEFPQGFQGVTKIFEYYITALSHRFQRLRTEYVLNPNLISKAIKQYSLRCFENDNSTLSLEEASKFFSEEFPNYPFLLYDLIQESVFIRNIPYYSSEKTELVYFAYERFGDHLVAEELIKELTTKDDVVCNFQKGSKLGKIVEHNHFWSYRGIIEALAIILPEKYNLEIFEVYEWFFNEIDQNQIIRHDCDWLNHFIIDSLKWRKIDSINNEKLINWFNSKFFRIRHDEYLQCIVELSTIKEHPFNSNKLYVFLMQFSMPQRDGFWQKHMMYYHGFDDNGVAYPLQRLIDWAWSSEISLKVDEETAVLAAQTLSWILSSTNRKLRDQATKALINLLEQQPNALLVILEKFKEVDDKYILERLYAVAYGCILRVRDIKSIELIGNYVYNVVFANGNPPNHILLRDYARNAVEYLIYKQPQASIDTKKIRPPYNSVLPQYPSNEDINQFHIDYDSPEFDKEYGQVYNRIHVSVMDWDFGRKIVEPNIDRLYPISFTKKREYKKFIRKLPKKQRKHLSNLKELVDHKEHFIKNRFKVVNAFGDEKKYNEFITSIEDTIIDVIDKIDQFFDEDQEYIKNEIIPYLQLKALLKYNTYNNFFDTTPVKRWIVKRAFELGYDVKLHGEYDKYYIKYYQGDQVERIGKKYQWIAYHEILSIITDNYKLKELFSGAKYKYYEGAWEFYARDIDPAYVTKDSEEPLVDDMKILEETPQWWHDKGYNYWDQENDKWSKHIDDLPDVKYVISKEDDEKQEWLFLNKFVKWNMPKLIGRDKYDMFRKEIWYLIQGYIVKRDDKDKTISFLKNKNFWGRWMPEPKDQHEQVFNREKYWSPAYKASENEEAWIEIYDEGRATGLFVMPCTSDAKASISDDKSEAESTYTASCQTLFEGLELNYSPVDGNFINNNNELIVQNIPLSGGAMIRKKTLIDFLDRNELAIIWTVLGEKLAFNPNGTGKTKYSCEPCGVFYLDNEEIKGEMIYHEGD